MLAISPASNQPSPDTCCDARDAQGMAGGQGRRTTRGVIPALNKELEQLMATAPVAPPV